jgi:DNA recombination protein RmuC
LEDAKVTLSDTFRSLASEALAGNNRGFLTLAEEKFKALKEETAVAFDQRHTSIESLLHPLTESLRTYQQESKDLEDKRLRELSAVGEQLRQLASAQSILQTETSKLVNALRSPQVRGRWGEIALRKTAELAGMSKNCDFFEQDSVATDTGRLRPDMIVKLPAGRDVVVDSKVPLSAFLESLEAHTDEDREAALNRHLGQVKRHISQLAAKEYWDQFPSAPEFVVLFIPNDSFLAAAAERDPSLVESALTKKVVIATPTTFIALLRAIAYGWRQEQVAEGAQRISVLGQELADRMSTMAEHFSKVGQALGRSVESYNATVTSLENRILPTARKFKALGINTKKDIMDLQSVDHIPRSPRNMDPYQEDFPSSP